MSKKDDLQIGLMGDEERISTVDLFFLGVLGVLGGKISSLSLQSGQNEGMMIERSAIARGRLALYREDLERQLPPRTPRAPGTATDELLTFTSSLRLGDGQSRDHRVRVMREADAVHAVGGLELAGPNEGGLVVRGDGGAVDRAAHLVALHRHGD